MNDDLLPALFDDEDHGFAPPKPGQTNVAALLKAFIDGRKNENTKDAYRRDLMKFCKWTQRESLKAATEYLVSHGRGHANQVALYWRNTLEREGTAPATINRHLTALRSLVKAFEAAGFIDWTLVVPNVEHLTYRDTSGPTVPAFKQLLSKVDERGGDAIGRRNTAILRMLFSMALRRKEVRDLHLKHLDFHGRRVYVLRKGRKQREWITMPDGVVEALQSWLEVRGYDDGPLFISYDPAAKGSGQLTLRSITAIVSKVGNSVNVKASPHRLRHAALSASIEANGGNLVETQALGGHSDPRTTMIYLDRLKNTAGKAAQRIDDLLEPEQRS